MIQEKLTGIIFGLRPHAEFDRMVVLFSAEHGLIHVMAKGVRKSGSRRGSSLDILNEAQIEVELSRSGIRYVREITTLATHQGIKKNHAAYAAACLIGSFIRKVLPLSAPQQKLFESTLRGLDSLEKGADPQKVLRAYFVESMEFLGYLSSEKRDHAGLSAALTNGLNYIDPGFILHARRTLGTFSK